MLFSCYKNTLICLLDSTFNAPLSYVVRVCVCTIAYAGTRMRRLLLVLPHRRVLNTVVLQAREVDAALYGQKPDCR